MFSIVIYHHFLFLKALGHEESWILGGYTILHFGVPVFLLISGYFGIKLKLSKIVYLYLYCFVWRFLTYLIGCFYFKTATIRGGQLLECFQPFTKSSGQWFLLPYFVLMLIVPILNKAIEAMSKKEFVKVLIVFSFIIFYWGLLCQHNIIDKGHSILYFIYMYLLGRYISIYRIGYNWKIKKIVWGLFIYTTIILCANFVLPHGILRAFRGLVFSYISPGLIISSAAILILFSKIHLRSKATNYLAVSSLSIYLFHENIFIPLKQEAALYAYGLDWYVAIPMIVLSSLLIMALALIIDVACVRNIVSFVHPLLVRVLNFIKEHFCLVLKSKIHG